MNTRLTTFGILLVAVLTTVGLFVLAAESQREDEADQSGRWRSLPRTMPITPSPEERPAPCGGNMEKELECPEWVDGSGRAYRFPERVQSPEIVHRVEPEVTAAAREQRVWGMVVLEVGIRPDGSVGGVCVLKGLPCGLDRSAVDAVRQWRFRPHVRAGEAREVVTTILVRFGL